MSTRTAPPPAALPDPLASGTGTTSEIFHNVSFSLKTRNTANV